MNLQGVFPPITTPFRDDEVDPVALARNAERWMTTDLAGLVVLGSNGEAPLLDEDESDRAIAGVRPKVPRGRLLIAGTGRESTRATIAATRRAAKQGADAALVRTPSYFKSRMTDEVFVRHYSAVADASPVPILLYNVTTFTGVNLRPEAVARLAEHPNIVGVKESGGDVAQIADLVASAPEGFAVLAGSAPTFYASLSAGAAGGVLALSCVVPELCVRLFELARARRHEEAAALQRRLTPLARLVTSVHGIAGLKAALDLAGYVGGNPRPPLLPVGDTVLEAIREQLAALQAVPASG